MSALAKVIPLHKTREVDVIVRKCPGQSDLRDQVGILFVDSWPDGTVCEVTFEPFYQKLKNVVIRARGVTETPTQIAIVDDDDGKRWTFEVNEIEGLDDEEGDDDDDEPDVWDDDEEGT